jgi:hypothetical protein
VFLWMRSIKPGKRLHRFDISQIFDGTTLGSGPVYCFRRRCDEQAATVMHPTNR